MCLTGTESTAESESKQHSRRRDKWAIHLAFSIFNFTESEEDTMKVYRAQEDWLFRGEVNPAQLRGQMTQ